MQKSQEAVRAVHRPSLRFVAFTAAIGLAGSATSGCGSSTDAAPPVVAIVPGARSLVAGTTLSLAARDSTGATLDATWTTSDVGVLAITPQGLLTGHRVGNASVDAVTRYGRVTAQFTVTPGALAGLRATPSSIAMRVGETSAVHVIGVDSEGNAVVGTPTIASANPATVEVERRSFLTGAMPGTAVVNATLENSSLAIPVTVSSSFTDSFVHRVQHHFVLQDRLFRFVGTNGFYMANGTPYMIADVTARAARMGFNVWRVFAFAERGSLDGTMRDTDPIPALDVTAPRFHSWDPATGAPVYNDSGPDGLPRLDLLLYRARQLGARVILSLVDNWSQFGGMEQYLAWYGLEFHDQFYTDPRVKAAYRNWVAHLIDRVNPLTGIRYGDDPTIMAWELTNELQCWSTATAVTGTRVGLPASGACTPDVTTAWANEMANFIKARDGNHLVSVGDGGLLQRPDLAGSGWPYNARDRGTDYQRLLEIPAVDFGSPHVYPELYGFPPAWGTDFVQTTLDISLAVGKPVILGELGVSPVTTRTALYDSWLGILSDGGSGVLPWMLMGNEYPGSVYGSSTPDLNPWTFTEDSALGHYWQEASAVARGAGMPAVTTCGAATLARGQVCCDGAVLSDLTVPLCPACATPEFDVVQLQAAGADLVASTPRCAEGLVDRRYDMWVRISDPCAVIGDDAVLVIDWSNGVQSGTVERRIDRSRLAVWTDHWDAPATFGAREASSVAHAFRIRLGMGQLTNAVHATEVSPAGACP
jgi:hypothetical protein